jgi:iron complex outermembrane receptor protein
MVQNSNPKGRAPFAATTALLIACASIICLTPQSAWGQVPQGTAPQSSTTSDPILIARAPPGSPSTSPVAGNQSQLSATNPTQLQEVVVTARRRDESLQQVPIAITAIDQDTLERQGVNTLTDLQQLVPSAYVTGYAHGSSQQFFSIRGQSESGLNTGGGAGGGAAVVGYFSEVPVPMSGPGLYYDLQSVQVLNGPQGTLFGRNTTGGAVLFEPQRPDLGKVEGYGQLLGGDYDRAQGEAAINIPVIDGKLAIRIAGQAESREGYTKDVNTGVEYDNRHFQAARIGVLFQPNDILENYFIANYLSFNEHGPGAELIAANPSVAADGAAILSYLAAQQARGVRATALDVAELDQGIFSNLINKTSVKLADEITLRNILSYSTQKIRRQDDEDGTTAVLLDSVGSAPGTWLRDNATTTEELQLQGKSFADAFNWQTGLYYEDDSTPNPADQTYTQQLVLLPLYFNTIDTNLGGTTTGLYGQGTTKLNSLLEGLSFTAGYRYTWDRLHEGYSQSLGATRTPAPGDFCLSIAGGVFFPNCDVYAAASHGGSSYTLGFDYQVNPATLLYLVSRQGYKSGGFNIVAATVGDITSPAFSYKPETVRDVEVGIKTDWSMGNMRGRTNVALYNSWYLNAQVNTSELIEDEQEAVTQNAARATIRGLEIENFLQPTSFTELTLNYSYMDAYYNRYVTPLGQDLTSLPYAYAPRNKGSASARVRLPFPGSIGEIWLGGNFTYQDRVFAGFSAVTPGSYMPSYGLLGLRADWEKISGTGLSASVFMTNVTDKVYRVANEDLYTTIGTSVTVYGEPRMYGALLRYQF